MYVAFENPELFGNCAAQSTPFGYGDGSLLALIEGADPKSIRLYVDCGTFETGVSGYDLLEQNRIAEALFRSKEYELKYDEYPEGHSWGSWRARLDEILTYFFSEDRGER